MVFNEQIVQIFYFQYFIQMNINLGLDMNLEFSWVNFGNSYLEVTNATTFSLNDTVNLN